MGFVNVSERVESINFAKERALINYLWVCLEGAKNRGITYRNLLLFIFAIMGIQIDLPKHKKKKNYSKNPA